MSGYLLDTNILSEFSRSRPEPRVLQWFEKAESHQLYLSVITVGEIRKGCSLLASGTRREVLENWLHNEVQVWFSHRILPVDVNTVMLWGDLDAKRQQFGRPLSTADGLIAATALQHGLTLLTRNVKDFADLDVPMVNPAATPDV